MVALQCCVDFAIQKLEPAICTHIPSLLSLLPIPVIPILPLGLAETKVGSLYYIIASHQPFISHVSVCKSMLLSQLLPSSCSSTVSTDLFCISASLFLLYK